MNEIFLYERQRTPIVISPLTNGPDEELEGQFCLVGNKPIPFCQYKTAAFIKPLLSGRFGLKECPYGHHAHGQNQVVQMKRQLLVAAFVVLTTSAYAEGVSSPQSPTVPAHPQTQPLSVSNQDVELKDAPTIVVDWSKGNVQYVILGGDRRFEFINGQPSGRYVLVITQDATGSRIPIWPKSVHWPGEDGGASVFTTTAHKTDYITFFFNRHTRAYDVLGLSQNYNGEGE